MPGGLEKEFGEFGTRWEAAAEREDSRKSRWDNVKAAVDLHTRKKQEQTSESKAKHSQDQFMLAALEKPSRFRTRLQRVRYEGPTARKDAEDEVRARWLHVLCGIVANTNTPMGEMIRNRPESYRILAAGRRATTLRARTRAIRKSGAFSVSFPNEVTHVTEYLQMKFNEPSNRGSIKGAHRAMCFFEEVCGVKESDRFTNDATYLLAKREVLAAALPGALPRQAPRFPTALLAAVEDLVLNESVPCYFRIFGWWILVQAWGMLRFSDHRGISPSQVTLDERGFTARLVHSKTIGSDRNVGMGLVVIDGACYFKHEGWMATGWLLLQREAQFERDYLLPSPTGNYSSCKKQELKYAIGSAIQGRVLSLLKLNEETLFRFRVIHYWTPHSGRNFMPSATGALGFSRQDRDVLGGWSAEGSERYTRLARQRISSLQVAVTTSLQDKSKADPLFEEESHQCLEAFHQNLKERCDSSLHECFKVLSEWWLLLNRRQTQWVQTCWNLFPSSATKMQKSQEATGRRTFTLSIRRAVLKCSGKTRNQFERN